MAVDSWKYLPILKWKRGEQVALRELTTSQWVGITPLIELQPIDAIPTFPEIRGGQSPYVEKVAKEIERSIPSGQQVFVDTHLVSIGYEKQTELLLAICRRLERLTGRSIFPVVSGGELDLISGLGATAKARLGQFGAVLVRLNVDEIDPMQIVPLLKLLVEAGVRRNRVHLLVDQYSLVGRNPAACLANVEPYLVQANVASCASVTVGGGSFPMSLTGIKPGAGNIPRVEWRIWEALKASGKFPGLRYADYAVTNPAPLPEIDPKAVNPAIAIRYAIDGNWHLLKGKGFKGAPKGELVGLCRLLVGNPAVYSGSAFSYGDRKYDELAAGNGKNGIPWTWRRDATNHHIVFTAMSL